MYFKIIRSFEELESRRDDVIEFTSKYANSIFGRYSWFSNWLKVYSKEVEIYCYLFYKEETLVSIIPLIIKKKERRILCFAGDPLNDLNELMCINEFEDEVYSIIIDEIGKLNWDLILLQSISKKLYGIFLFSFNKMDDFILSELEFEYSPYISLPQTINEFYSNLPTSLSKTYKYILRRLDKGVEYNFCMIPKMNDTKDYIKVFEENRIASWKRRNRLHELPPEIKNNKFEEFISYIVSSMTNEGNLLLPVIKKNDKILATGLYFLVNGKMLKYMQSWNPDYSNLSLGTALDLYMIKYAIDNNIYLFDFGRGTELYKNNFCNNQDTLINFIITRN